MNADNQAFSGGVVYVRIAPCFGRDSCSSVDNCLPWHYFKKSCLLIKKNSHRRNYNSLKNHIVLNIENFKETLNSVAVTLIL